ncbi:hypothetical protein Tco_0400883 [Tanacetum coccineum]
MIWNYYNEGMLLKLVKNLYVPFGIPFDPKLFYKDGGYTGFIQFCELMLQKPRLSETEDGDQGMTKRLRMQHMGDNGEVLFITFVWRRLLGIHRPLVREVILEFFSTCRWGEVVLDLGTDEMQNDGFRAYWEAGLRGIATKADLADYWSRISYEQSLWTLIVKVVKGPPRQQIGAADGVAEIDPEVP